MCLEDAIALWMKKQEEKVKKSSDSYLFKNLK